MNLEQLANLEHDSWSHWMKYLFSISKENEDGSVTIPKDKVSRWKKQMKTKYEDLSEKEKESDRKEARIKIVALKNKKLVKESLI